MRKPFYEEDFNVEEYVNKKILEMDSISDRILYKQMAELFMIDLFDMTRKEILKISKSVIDELERKEEKVEIYTGIIESSKYDKTDTFEVNDTSDYLAEDYMSYITTIIQEYRQEYYCVGEIMV